MSASKTKCAKCDVEILLATANRTGGLCMPCENGTPKIPDPNEPLKVSCKIDWEPDSWVTVTTTAQKLLSALDETRHIGNSKHPNKYELEAQRALLRHAIRHRVEFRLNDDHWGRTKWALLKLFDQCAAEIESEGTSYVYPEVEKENWREGTNPSLRRGGFLYRARDGKVIYKVMSWFS